MGRVLLTDEQKAKARFDAKSQLLADGLAAFKNRNHLTNRQISDGFGMCHTTITKLLEGDDVKLPIKTVWRVLEIAGLEVHPRKKPGERE